MQRGYCTLLPYLIIEDDMRDALITAAQGGVDVRIITPFIPDKKNVKILTIIIMELFLVQGLEYLNINRDSFMQKPC